MTNSDNNTVSVLLGNGDGTFRSQITYTTGSTPWSVESGDFNNDKKMDLAVANRDSSDLSIFLNTCAN